MGLFSRKSKKNEDNQKAKDESKKALQVLRLEDIEVNLATVEKFDAIRMAGRMLVSNGCVDEEYIQAMVDRENTVTTYIGQGVAIPHGVGTAKQYIKKTGLVVLQFKDGVDFDGEKAYILVGIAALGDEHLPILTSIAKIMMEEDQLEEILHANNAEIIYNSFTGK